MQAKFLGFSERAPKIWRLTARIEVSEQRADRIDRLIDARNTGRAKLRQLCATAYNCARQTSSPRHENYNFQFHEYERTCGHACAHETSRHAQTRGMLKKGGEVVGEETLNEE